MPPPPPPHQVFRGVTVTAVDRQGYLGFHPVGDHALWPPARPTLYLPAPRILGVEVVPTTEPGWWALRFHGEFAESGLPDDPALAPLTEADARGLAAVLGERLALPRRPKPVQARDLTGQGNTRIEDGAYVAVVGTAQRLAHHEAADFSGIRLIGPRAPTPRTADRRYLVTGFYGAPPVGLVGGYTGATLYVRSIDPEPDGPVRAPRPVWTPPPSPSRSGPVVTVLQPTARGGQPRLALQAPLDPDTLLVALVDGMFQADFAPDAARLAQLTLATLLEARGYAPALGLPVEPPPNPDGHLAEWAAWLVDRSALPRDPAPLLDELRRRVGAVLEGVELRGHPVAAGGILAAIGRGRATLLRRGGARAYLLRDGELHVVVHEDVMGRDPRLLGDPAGAAAAARYYWVLLSRFTPHDPPETAAPVEVELRPGDRLIFVAGTALLEAIDADPARERLLAAAIPDPAGVPPSEDMIERGWGVVAVDVRHLRVT